MKNTCYCVECKLHPLYAQRENFANYVVGFHGESIEEKFKEQGREVNCFIPTSYAEDELDVMLDTLQWSPVAYGDGSSVSYSFGSMHEIWANCENEN